MEFVNSNWVRDGVYYYPHLFGGIMLTCALLSFSTSYFGVFSVPTVPSLIPQLRFLHKKKISKKRVRVYMDGCFDLMHYGHANALRQAKELGDELVVGVVSDEEIVANKGPPVLSMQERLALVSGLKWVDEVIADAPYAITEEFMNRLFNEHRIDYIIHGDDPCTLPDGTDAYALAKKAGRYKQIKRTEGVSSTDIVGRILSYMKDDEAKTARLESGLSGEFENSTSPGSEESRAKGHISHFLPTSRRIVQFSNGTGPGPNYRVVYIDGAFDLFHAGHVEILKKARQLGDFLLVGIYTDQTVSELRGSHFPLMNLHERSLSVLACRYVDEVIIGAPLEVTKDMITTFNISLVVHGTVTEDNCFLNGKSDPYSVPKSMEIFKILESPKDMTTTSIAQRIIANHELYVSAGMDSIKHIKSTKDGPDIVLSAKFSGSATCCHMSNHVIDPSLLRQKRNAKKEASEKKYYEEKKYVSGD
ncbi:ethanolamine-phosphate cytidylyltransferase [Dorcoceras hygrometricum]|uniref:ethanolamine-phosphate cytidylyltransferase n=1 Tax=Dorcoceras hygrometricum TaxID=472368 RepID=A0A2Z7A987_9LAMI|nr:ethanolamine-phosphate cytidylyltransferase [Dorcoceras hygrometricum]